MRYKVTVYRTTIETYVVDAEGDNPKQAAKRAVSNIERLIDEDVLQPDHTEIKWSGHAVGETPE